MMFLQYGDYETRLQHRVRHSKYENQALLITT